MIMGLWLLLIIIAVLLLICFLIYNSLIVSRNNVKNAWSQIDVQLKKRYDLVPNLVETVKGYAKYEAKTLETITSMRAQAMQAKTTSEELKANEKMSKAIGGLINAVAENYPDLKASQNYLMLQEELSGIENKIAYSRQYYNDSVMRLNNKIEMFPTNIFANMFNFKKQDFLETDTKEREPVKVSF
jgi:LemA protein